MNFVKENKFIFIVAFFSIFAITPLFKSEFFFATHDMLAPVYRLLELDTCLRDGVLFPRWAPDLYGGRGAPLFNYYAPFSYFVAETFHLASLNYINSIKATYLLSFILSGLFMYLLARDRANAYCAVLAAVLYMYMPYHLFDVYTRGALAESFAFVFLPLVLYSLERGRITLGAISYALLILTHNITAMLFTGFLIFYLIVFRKELPLKNALTAIFFGLALSAFYWIPALFEKDLVNIENVKMFTPHESFLGFYDIISKIGIIPLLLVFGALDISKNNRTRFLGVTFFALVFFMSKYSSPFWSLPLAGFVQFPMRLMVVAALIVSLLGAVAASKIKSGSIILGLSLLVVLSSYGSIGYSEEITIPDNDITSSRLRNLNAGLTFGNEFLPKDATIMNVKNEQVIFGQGDIEITGKSCNSFAFDYSGSGNPLLINKYYFPGWTSYMDGTLISTHTNQNGMILLDIPAGHHEILLKFEDTPIRKISEVLSFLAFMVLALQKAREYREASRCPRD